MKANGKDVNVFVGGDGDVQMVYDDDVVVLFRKDDPSIQRASHVEPTSDGKWLADLWPVGGPQLGPYVTRAEALAAEVAWLDNALAQGEVARVVMEVAQRAKVIADRLAGGGVLLVAGVYRTSSLPETVLNYPRFVIWQSEETWKSTPDVPSNTRHILALRYLKHKAGGQLILAARSRGIGYEYLGNATGQLRETLETIMQTLESRTFSNTPRVAQPMNGADTNGAATTAAPAAPVEQPRKSTRTGLKSALVALTSRGRIDWTKSDRALAAELFDPIVAEFGAVTINTASLAQGFYALRTTLGITAPPRGPVSNDMRAARAAKRSAGKKKRQAAVAAMEGNDEQSFTALVKMIDDQAASLELLREFVEALRARQAQYHTSLTKLREAMKTLGIQA